MSHDHPRQINGRHATGHADRHRRAFSLVELLVALSVLSILMLAMGSAVVLSAKALPSPDSPNTAVLRAARALDHLADDLRGAVHITHASATTVTFVVADRSGDGAPEVITYAWSGTGGDPLTRTQNGGTAQTIIEAVHSLHLTFDQTNEVTWYPGPAVESAETELASHNAKSGLSNFTVTETEWTGQYFAPTLPADTLSWRVTRVLINAKRDDANSNDITRVQLRPPDANNLPRSLTYEEELMYESTLQANYTWQEFTFSDVADLPVDDGLCLVLTTTGNTGASRMEYQSSVTSTPNQAMLEYNGSWASAPTQSLQYYVYGTTTSLDADISLTRQRIRSVRVDMTLDNKPNTQLGVTVPTLNAPPVVTEVWDVDFQSDPTAKDLDADNHVDWQTDGSFNTGALSGGVWTADQTLTTTTGPMFDEPTTIEVVMRDTTPGVGSTVMAMHVDGSGTSAGLFTAALSMLANGTQALVLTNMLSPGPHEVLATIKDLPADFVTLRLMVDPVGNRINVNVNGDDAGTFDYTVMSTGAAPRVALLPMNGETGAEFDSIRIEIGGTVGQNGGAQ